MAQAKHDSITRRSLFGALAVPIASAPIAAAPALAPDVAAAPSGLQPLPPPPDPIFGAIETHRRTYAASTPSFPNSQRSNRPPGMRRAENAAPPTGGSRRLMRKNGALAI